MILISVWQLTVTTRQLSEGPDENLIARLRVLERKMGLVLTLVCQYRFTSAI